MPAAGMIGFAAFAYIAAVLAVSFLLWRQLQIAGERQPFGRVFLWQGVIYAAWFPMAAVVWELFQRLTILRATKICTALGALVIPLHVVLSIPVDASMAEPGNADLIGLAAQRVQLDLLIYVSFGVLTVGAIFRKRAEEQAAEAAAVRAALDAARAALAKTPPAPEPQLMVSTGVRRVLVSLEEVEWFSSAGNYVVANWGGREGIVRQTLQSMEARLDPMVFARIHRGTIVNLSKVEAAEPLRDGSWRLVLTSGAELILSRTYRETILDRLKSTGPIRPT